MKTRLPKMAASAFILSLALVASLVSARAAEPVATAHSTAPALLHHIATRLANPGGRYLVVTLAARAERGARVARLSVGGKAARPLVEERLAVASDDLVSGIWIVEATDNPSPSLEISLSRPGKVAVALYRTDALPGDVVRTRTRASAADVRLGGDVVGLAVGCGGGRCWPTSFSVTDARSGIAERYVSAHTDRPGTLEGLTVNRTPTARQAALRFSDGGAWHSVVAVSLRAGAAR